MFVRRTTETDLISTIKIYDRIKLLIEEDQELKQCNFDLLSSDSLEEKVNRRESVDILLLNPSTKEIIEIRIYGFTTSMNTNYMGSKYSVELFSERDYPDFVRKLKEYVESIKDWHFGTYSL